MPNEYDAIILGAGAAGLMCAIEAGKRGRRVAILERAGRIGKKILISGGGRCNFTNIYCQPENFISSNPHFVKSPLARFTPRDFIEMVESHSIPYHEKTLGQLFCDRAASDITDMLASECQRAGVEIFFQCDIKGIERNSVYAVRTGSAEFLAPSLVVATGGLSIPKVGATALGYEIARRFELKIRETKPALVPLVFGPRDRKRYCDLAGISLEVIASVGDVSFHEKMLITHRGLSGPAILQVSSYWEKGMPLRIDLAPNRIVLEDVKSVTPRGDATVRTALHGIWSSRFATRWLEIEHPTSWTNASLDELERKIHAWEVTPIDTEGFEKAEVTAGGVDTDELSAKTMECHKVPGLYFIGEVVDVTGHLGGFNFQWAWSSGAAAGRAL